MGSKIIAYFSGGQEVSSTSLLLSWAEGEGPGVFCTWDAVEVAVVCN